MIAKSCVITFLSKKLLYALGKWFFFNSYCPEMGLIRVILARLLLKHQKHYDFPKDLNSYYSVRKRGKIEAKVRLSGSSNKFFLIRRNCVLE